MGGDQDERVQCVLAGLAGQRGMQGGEGVRSLPSGPCALPLSFPCSKAHIPPRPPPPTLPHIHSALLERVSVGIPLDGRITDEVLPVRLSSQHSLASPPTLYTGEGEHVRGWCITDEVLLVCLPPQHSLASPPTL